MKNKRNMFYMLVFVGVTVFTVFNRFKIKRIEKNLYDIKEKNCEIDNEIEDIKDEIGSVYSHLEVISNLDLEEI